MNPLFSYYNHLDYLQDGGYADDMSGQDQTEQIVQFIAQALQGGTAADEILTQLIEAGIPEDQATEVIQAVADQLETSGASEMRMGGKTMPCYGCGGVSGGYAYGGPTKQNYTYSAGVSYQMGGFVPEYNYTPEFMMVGGELAKGGGIHIKPENKGKFTKKAKAAGMGVQAFASKVLSAPEGKYSASTRKQANFARNAAGWKKAEMGGQYEVGGEYKVSKSDIEKLLKMGYKIQYL